MTNPRPRSRFQFSIRKLLLWTAVFAVYCGFWRWLGWLEAGVSARFVWITSWLVVVTCVRLMWGVKAAIVVSVAWFLISITVQNFHRQGLLAMLLELFPFVVFFGLITVGIVEGAVRLVNWADDFMATKSHND